MAVIGQKRTLIIAHSPRVPDTFPEISRDASTPLRYAFPTAESHDDHAQ